LELISAEIRQRNNYEELGGEKDQNVQNNYQPSRRESLLEGQNYLHRRARKKSKECICKPGAARGGESRPTPDRWSLFRKKEGSERKNRGKAQLPQCS